MASPWPRPLLLLPFLMVVLVQGSGAQARQQPLRESPKYSRGYLESPKDSRGYWKSSGGTFHDDDNDEVEDEVEDYDYGYGYGAPGYIVGADDLSLEDNVLSRFRSVDALTKRTPDDLIQKENARVTIPEEPLDSTVLGRGVVPMDGRDLETGVVPLHSTVWSDDEEDGGSWWDKVSKRLLGAAARAASTLTETYWTLRNQTVPGLKKDLQETIQVARRYAKIGVQYLMDSLKGELNHEKLQVLLTKLKGVLDGNNEDLTKLLEIIGEKLFGIQQRHQEMVDLGLENSNDIESIFKDLAVVAELDRLVDRGVLNQDEVNMLLSQQNDSRTYAPPTKMTDVTKDDVTKDDVTKDAVTKDAVKRDDVTKDADGMTEKDSIKILSWIQTLMKLVNQN